MKYIAFLFLFLAAFTLQAQTGIPAYAWYDDDPSVSVFYIGTADDLVGFANLVNGADGKSATNFSGKIIMLADDVDISGYGKDTEFNDGNGWIPIGTSQNSFAGSFDGDGKVITGLYINDNDIGDVGLFGYAAYGSTIKNLGVVDADVTGNNYVGVVVGCTEGYITCCYSTGRVRGEYFVGGVAGYVYNITNSYSLCMVRGVSPVGGVAGNSFNVINCYSAGDVIGYWDLGGVVGVISYGGRITNCAALNSAITRMGGAPQSFGRVVGFIDDNDVITNNIAFNCITGDDVLDVTDDADGRGGKSKTFVELQKANGFPEALTQAPWTYGEGMLPGLGDAVEMPEYLTKDCPVTNIEELFAPNLNLYPNPFTDALHITGAEGCILSIFTESGAIVHIQKVVNPDEIIRLKHLPAGVFFFRIEKDGKAKTLKGIKN